LKCDAGKGWRISVESIVGEMKECYKESRRKGISYKQKKKEG